MDLITTNSGTKSVLLPAIGTSLTVFSLGLVMFGQIMLALTMLLIGAITIASEEIFVKKQEEEQLSLSPSRAKLLQAWKTRLQTNISRIDNKDIRELYAKRCEKLLSDYAKNLETEDNTEQILTSYISETQRAEAERLLSSLVDRRHDLETKLQNAAEQTQYIVTGLEDFEGEAVLGYHEERAVKQIATTQSHLEILEHTHGKVTAKQVPTAVVKSQSNHARVAAFSVIGIIGFIAYLIIKTERK